MNTRRFCTDTLAMVPPPISLKVKKLLVQSKAAYLQAASALSAAGGENTDVSAISQGAPHAALICLASEAVFPEAIALVRYMCCLHL